MKKLGNFFTNPLWELLPLINMLRLKSIRGCIMATVIVIFCTSGFAMKEKTLTNFSVQYRVKYQGIFAGHLTQKLIRKDNGTYEFYQRSYSNLPLIRKHTLEISKGFWRHYAIRPTYYALFKQPKASKQQIEIFFNWKTLKARAATKNQLGVFPIVNNTQDKLSCQLLFRQALLQKQISHFTCPYFDGRKIKSYRFNLVAREKLETTLGNLDTLKIEQRNPSSNKHHTIFWLSPAMDYLPVQVTYVADGRIESEAFIMQLQRPR